MPSTSTWPMSSNSPQALGYLNSHLASISHPALVYHSAAARVVSQKGKPDLSAHLFKTCHSESKVLTLTSQCSGWFFLPTPSFHFLSLAHVHPLPPSLSLCCYLNMLRIRIDFCIFSFSTCSTPLGYLPGSPLKAVRSLLKYYPLEGAFCSPA